MLLVAVVAAAAATVLVLPPRSSLALERATAPRLTVSMPWLAGGAAALTAGLLVSFPLSLLVAAAAGVVVARQVGRLEPSSVRRRRIRLEVALPHVVDLVATCLASGGSPSGALGRVARIVEPPMRDELAPYAGRLKLAADPVGVWAAMAEHPQLGPLGRALHRSTVTGAPVADALVRLSSELRASRRMAAEARARTIEVKASLPLGLCLLPAFVLVGVVPMVAGSFSLTFLGW